MSDAKPERPLLASLFEALGVPPVPTPEQLARQIREPGPVDMRSQDQKLHQALADVEDLKSQVKALKSAKGSTRPNEARKRPKVRRFGCLRC